MITNKEAMATRNGGGVLIRLKYYGDENICSGRDAPPASLSHN